MISVRQIIQAAFGPPQAEKVGEAFTPTTGALIQASVEAKSSSGKHVMASIDAGTGGPMNIGGYYSPVVVVWRGMTAAKTVPILDSHINAISAQLGVGTATIGPERLSVQAKLMPTGRGRVAIQAIEHGGLQASLGAEVLEARTVEGPKSFRANKRTINVADGERMIVVTKSKLAEVSLVPIAADSDTSVSLTNRVAAAAARSYLQETDNGFRPRRDGRGSAAVPQCRG